MRRIESVEDDMNRVVTYELHDGRRIKIDAKMVQFYGAEDAIRKCGGEPFAPGERERRLPLIHLGREVGSLPAWFDLAMIRSKSGLYEPRPGDFRREGDRWVADASLGHGDISSVPEFMPKS